MLDNYVKISENEANYTHQSEIIHSEARDYFDSSSKKIKY